MSRSGKQKSLLTHQAGKANWRMLALTTAIFIAALLAWNLIINSAPVPKRGQAKEVVRLVDTRPLTREATRPQLQVGGIVQASQSVALQAEVSGRIAWLSDKAEPGAYLTAGEPLAQIEESDYVSAVQQARASLAQARAELAIEEGQIALAQEEYELAGLELDDAERALVLREPQRQAAEAAVATAEASVDQAEANLRRTQLVMPFDGQILERNISLGSHSGSATSLFTLIGTGTFYIQAKVPRSFLSYLDQSQPAQVSLNSVSKNSAGQNSAGAGDESRTASLMSILPQVESSDRQVRVMLAVDQPLNPDKGPVLLANDYVHVLLAGHEIRDAWVVPRRVLTTEGGIWVVNNGELALRQVSVRYAGRDQVWISSGFEPGDSLLLSQVDAAVEGMKVRVSGSEAEKKTDQTLTGTSAGAGESAL